MNSRFITGKDDQGYVVIDTCRPVGFNLEETDTEYPVARCGQLEDAELIVFALNVIGHSLDRVACEMPISPDNPANRSHSGN